MVRNFFASILTIGSRTRALLILAFDATIAIAGFSTALLLRFDRDEIEPFRAYLPVILLLLVAARLAAVLFFRLHQWSFRFSGLPDGVRVGLAGLSGSALFVLAFHLAMPGVPAAIGRAVLAMELLITTSLMAAVRFAPRLALIHRAGRLRNRRTDALRTVIVGAGSAGEMLLRDLQRSDKHEYQVIGFVDDEPLKWGHVVGGKSVLGGVSDLPRLAKRHRLRQILIAVPNLPARRVREILELSYNLKLKFKILPVSFSYLRQRAASSMLQDLSPRDLLEREEVSFKHGPEASFLGDGCQMVVGAAGSIGSEVCAQLLEAGARRLVMVDIDENRLYLLKRRLERQYPDRLLVAELADVRDLPRLRVLFSQHRPADVFHAAARKQVPLMESAPGEAVKTNVLGTLNLARVASEYGAERFVFASTDKAVGPSSVMGATKRLGEMLIDRLSGDSPTRFSVVRFGNVLDTAGSVVPLFREQIAAGGPVTVTHPEATRYFMTVSEAVGLLLRAAYGNYGRLCVLEMGDPIRIVDLAKLLITMSGAVPEVDVAITYTGLRPGEKLFEELLADDEKVMRSVDRRIRVVAGTPPPPDLLERIDELGNAVAAEDAEAVLTLLRRLVPGFRPLLPAGQAEGWASESSTTINVM